MFEEFSVGGNAAANEKARRANLVEFRRRRARFLLYKYFIKGYNQIYIPEKFSEV